MVRIDRLTHETFPVFCRDHGLKCTAQRLAVFSAIRLSRSHPSVDETWDMVRKEIPTVTRTSVYRILNEFADVGLLARMDAFSAARYDTSTAPHAHFICTRCGAVFDYPMPGGIVLPEGMPKVRHHVELRVQGLCAKCAAASI